ncbi:MAG: 4-hydroxy-tetrahydrodipicolinate synthase [Dehalococcoidia bacterium]|nr:4-hydroxy-tetrahydrodipicolinate synthase [Dehalococcoidia bacterium]
MPTPRFGRLLTAMATPMDSSGAIDYAQAKRLARALVASGSEGLVISGTTGEAPTLTQEEKLRLFAAVKDEVGGQAAVIAGTGNYSTAETVEFTREAERLGVDGALVITPYYNKPSQAGLLAHFTRIAESTALPLILYNVPSRTALNMTADTQIALSRLPNIVGTKDASGMLDQIARIIEESEHGFSVWSGDDEATLPILAIGGWGVISVASHLVGLQIRTMIERFVAGDTAEAARIHRRLLPLVKALFITTSPVPLKHALNHMGFAVGATRLPLVGPEPAEAQVIERELARQTIDLALSV